MGSLYSLKRCIYYAIKCKLFFFIWGSMLAVIVKNNFLFSQHDACMYFSPNSHSKSTHGQWQHPITSSVGGNGSCSFHPCLFTPQTAFSWTSLVKKVIPLFLHHLWCTPTLTPNRSCSLQRGSLFFSHIQSELHLGKQIPDGLTISWSIKFLSI